MDSIIRDIEEDLQAEQDPERKKNIAACLAEAKKDGIYISSSQTLFVTNQKAFIVPNADLGEKWSALDAQSKRLLYFMVGLQSQPYLNSRYEWWLTMFLLQSGVAEMNGIQRID